MEEATLIFAEKYQVLNMVQAIASNETFLNNAVIERHNFTNLNKTRIRFQIKLKKTTKSNAPKWTDVLFSEGESESDLVKVKTRTYATGTVGSHLSSIYVLYKNGASKEDF